MLSGNRFSFSDASVVSELRKTRDRLFGLTFAFFLGTKKARQIRGRLEKTSF